VVKKAAKQLMSSGFHNESPSHWGKNKKMVKKYSYSFINLIEKYVISLLLKSDETRSLITNKLSS